MQNRKNEILGLATEIITAALYCGAFLVLVFLVVR